MKVSAVVLLVFSAVLSVKSHANGSTKPAVEELVRAIQSSDARAGKAAPAGAATSSVIDRKKRPSLFDNAAMEKQLELQYKAATETYGGSCTMSNRYKMEHLRHAKILGCDACAKDAAVANNVIMIGQAMFDEMRTHGNSMDEIKYAHQLARIREAGVRAFAKTAGIRTEEAERKFDGFRFKDCRPFTSVVTNAHIAKVKADAENQARLEEERRRSTPLLERLFPATQSN